MNRTHTDAIALFTDEPGWHGRQLVRWLEARGLTVRRVSLSDCTVDLGATGHGLIIPGFAGCLPRAAFVRGIAGGSLETITLRLDILHVLEALGCPVMNGARVIERTVDKAMTSLLLRRAGVPTPRTFVSASDTAAREYVRAALAAGRTLVKKPLFGSQGKGLVHVTAAAQLGSLLPGEVAYLQDFVACDGPGYRDYRVMVVDGQAVAAMERRSAHWVTNRAQGARCHGLRLDDVPTAMACAAAVAVGACYAGVDLLRAVDGSWWVTEVNGIPAWQGLQRATGTDITALLGTALLRRMVLEPAAVS